MQIVKRIIVYVVVLLTSTSGLWSGGQNKESDFPKAATEAKTLLLVSVPSDGSALTLASMQGLLANTSEKNLFFKAGPYEAWLQYTDAETVKTQPDGTPWDFPSLLKEFSSSFDGYILCDEESASIALSLANMKNSIVVLEEFEDTVTNAGLKITKDVRGISDLSFRLTPEFRKLRRDIAFEQPLSKSPRLLDYAVMSGAYTFSGTSVNRAEHNNAFRFLNDNALIFGWNNELSEYNTVYSFSRLNACLVPADWSDNLSVISGFSCDEVHQKTDVSYGSEGRTVCLLMSDGDNLQWYLSSYADSSHYGSSIRGQFPFSWGIPACSYDIAAPLTEMYYDNMDKNDSFVLSLSGMGYTFPSKWTDGSALKNMAATLGSKMKKLDIGGLLVLDDGGFNSTAIDTLMKETEADGIFYIDYSNYAGMDGKIRFSEGKPVVSAKYRLWNNLPGSSPEEIAKAVNELPADPENPDSYVFIIVHAWSGISQSGEFVEGGNTMRAVEQMVNGFDSNTRIVSPSQFFELIKNHCGQ